MKSWLSALLRSMGLRHGVIIGMAMIVAGALDYGVNVVAGRWLPPDEYGIFVSVTAIVQVLLLLSVGIRMVVAFYTAELSRKADSFAGVAAFVQRSWQWAWQWGLLAMAAMALASPFLGRLLQLPSRWPLWAASLMVLALFLRETAYGALQGIQAFAGLGLVQVTQAALRLLLATWFLWLQPSAAGAIVAQPLGCAVALCLAIWWLRPQFRHRTDRGGQAVSWHYSACTLLGLAAFGLLANLDALFVKHFFAPRAAGDYGPVVTLAKISLFLPWAIGIVLFPKVTQRQASGQDPRPILWLSLTAALAPGLAITTVYFLYPGMLVKAIFTSAYSNPGAVLGLASLAATLYAGLFIWLNYSLSLDRRGFVYALIGVLSWQMVGMFLFGRGSLIRMTLVMVSAGLISNLAGFATTRTKIGAIRAIPAEAAGQ